MSDLKRDKKPDRQLYRHPKYASYHSTTRPPLSDNRIQSCSSTSEGSSNRNNSSAVHERRFTIQKSITSNPQQLNSDRTKKVQKNICEFKENAKNYNPVDKKSYKDYGLFRVHSKPYQSVQIAHQISQRIGTFTTTVHNVTKASSDKHCETLRDSTEKTLGDVLPPSSKLTKCERHGGLIHIPENVDIYHNSHGSNNQNRQMKRDTTGYSGFSQKPVVVVRPSFRHCDQGDFFDSHTGTSQGRASLHKQDFPVDGTDGHHDDAGHYTKHLPSGTQDNPSCFTHKRQLKQVDALDALYGIQRLSLQPDATPLLPTIKAPNKALSMTVQQIISLDSALSALLIPPGICVQVIPQSMAYSSSCSSTDNSQWTETEHLIRRWWGAVQCLRDRLLSLYEEVILADLDFCNAAHVEQGMWKSVFYTVLELLRSWIANPESTSLVSAGDTPEGEKGRADLVVQVLQRLCLLDVIDTGEGHLMSLLERIQALNRVRLSPLLADGRPPPETRSRSRRLVYLSAQKLMLFLGDLARYRETMVGECNFGKARSWYQKAQLLVPKNGRSYNQLAVLAVYTSRHLDAMYYYMRTLATSNPFPTASQSLFALFNEIRPRAETLMKQLRKASQDVGSLPKSCSSTFATSNPRFQRVEIWVHPVDGQALVVQGTRRLYLSAVTAVVGDATAGGSGCGEARRHPARLDSGSAPSRSEQQQQEVVEEDDDDEEAQAEAEEYANMSLIQLSKQFGLTFLHAHGKLYTKIGMETFPEVASLCLQALSGLLAQSPCPFSADRLCQLCVVHMYSVDRAVSLTSSTASSAVTATAAGAGGAAPPDSPSASQPLFSISHMSGAETLRSVHHDHAARFALDAFSLLCRRAARLLQQTPPGDSPSWWISPDATPLLAALRLWSEWMILHPEHWLPSPNHRDPTLRPYLDEWNLVAGLCTRAAEWLSRNPVRPTYEEITPTTSLVLRYKCLLKGSQTGSADSAEHNELEDEAVLEDKLLDDPSVATDVATDSTVTFLYEEAFVAGFKPMLDLVHKMYRYTSGGKWDANVVANFVRLDKLVLFGDFLCGIEPPVLTYDVDRATYVSVMEKETSENQKDRRELQKRGSEPTSGSVSHLETVSQTGVVDHHPQPGPVDMHEQHSGIEEIAVLQRQRALLRRQLEEEQRLAIWRQQAIRQAASGGRRPVELEVRPVYLLPDTNCYIDWLAGVATLAQRCSNYTVLVPIVVVNELDTLARSGGASRADSGPVQQNRVSRSCGSRIVDLLDAEDSNSIGVTKTGLIQERARAAISYLEHEFSHRNSRLRALTARGSFLETIAYRNEINGGREVGQTNDDVILACCNHFCKEEARNQFGNSVASTAGFVDGHNQPIRLVREVVLLTSDRNLRVKALNINVPARPLRTFVAWSRLPPIANLSISTDTSEPTLTASMTTASHERKSASQAHGPQSSQLVKH